MLHWMFSAIMGDPTWIRAEAYGNIELEYSSCALYEPFAQLIR